MTLDTRPVLAYDDDARQSGDWHDGHGNGLATSPFLGLVGTLRRQRNAAVSTNQRQEGIFSCHSTFYPFRN